MSRRRVLVPERLHRWLEPWIAGRPGLGERLVVLPAGGWEGVPCGEVTGAVLWSWSPGELAAAVLEHCPRLRWLHSTWTGVEHLPLEALASRRIVLTTAAGVVARPLAEWVAAAILWRAKSLRTLEHQQAERRWRPVRAMELEGLRVLLLGLGNIGRAAARLLRGFGVHLAAVRASGRPSSLVREVLPPGRLAEAASRTDVLVVSVPLTPATRGMVDQDVLAALPDGAGVVNVARGEVVDEPALAAELVTGRLWAALDVFSTEPLPADSPLWDLENVLISPHSAHASPHHRERHLELVRDLIARHLEGRRLRNVHRW